MTTRIQDQSPEVADMAQEWPMLQALTGGTRTMREAGESLLPKWPNEEDVSYHARKKTATLYPAFSRTVSVMGGKPFSKSLTYGSDVPEVMRPYLEDCDLEGRNLHAFAADVMSEVLDFGICGVLVDYPDVGQVATLADEQAIGARPYFVHIKHSQILGWKSEKINGVQTLTQLRLAEKIKVDDGDYGSMMVDAVRVLTRGAYKVWREDKDKKYVLFSEGTTSLADIPFVPFYGHRLGFMMGESPLIDLAYLNVKHWQSQSDQDTLLHVARVPILFMKGFPESAQITVGASSGVKSDSTDADMKYVEHSGAAISAGRESLIDLEQQMIQTGAELLVQKPGVRSATESNNEHEANKCELQRITEVVEDALDQCLQFMADWLGLPEGGHVALFKDFGAGTLTDASAQLILSMQQGGLITKATALREQQRRGMLSPDLDPDEELEMVGTEGPMLGGVMPEPIEAPEDDAEDEVEDEPRVEPAAPVPVVAPVVAPVAAPLFDYLEFARILAEAIGRIPGAVVNVPEQAAPIVNMPPITVEGSTINVTSPEQQAPVVNVAPASVTVNMPEQQSPVVNVPVVVNTPEVSMPAVNVSPAAVTVNVPEQPASVINVAPPSVSVTVEKGGAVRFIEDAAGNLTGAVME